MHDTCERYVTVKQNGYPTTEIQMPWWAGYNEARRGEPYRNTYKTLTSKYEYQKGYDTGNF